MGAAVNRNRGWYSTTRLDWHLPHPATSIIIILFPVPEAKKPLSEINNPATKR
jgi:hypothetical protein